MRLLRNTICMALLLSACETVVEIDVPPEAPRLVVNAILEQDSLVRFQLSQSKSALDNRPLRTVSGAEALLFQDGREVTRFWEEAEGWYRSDHRAEAGSTYSIRVSRQGYEPVAAETNIYTPVPISGLDYDTAALESSVYYQEKDSLVINEYIYPSAFRLTIDDPANEENYYEVAVLKDVVLYQRTPDESGDLIIVDTTAFRFPAYLYSDDPVFGNNNDIFDDFSGERGEYLMFSDEIFDGKTYTLHFNYDGQTVFTEEETHRYYVILRTLNQEQYLYFRSVRLQDETEGNPFAEPVPVYNNIVGGFGIFTGFSRDVTIIALEQ